MPLKLFACCLLLATASTSIICSADRPNVLIVISDDQSYPHASAYGDAAISTPGFDRVAKSGVLFRNAFTPAPGCSPMRAAFLTGRQIWQNREAGTHASSFPTDLPVFTKQLENAGYHVGLTGKGWGPGRAIGWNHNPAGKGYSKRKMTSPKGISNNDYAANFEDFLAARETDQPFCFWMGGSEPHRTYDQGIGARNGIDLDAITVPEFLPDTPEIRGDIADYLYEIQWFDQHLQRALDRLEADGELSSTMVIVTSDNGMPFPRAKANLYEFGIHMPLAISWPKQVPGKQVNDDLVSLIDVTRTIFDAADVDPAKPTQMSGNSLLPRISGNDPGGVSASTAVYSGRERHSSSRYNSLSYPCRCIRTQRFLYIRNFTPDRWPAGPAKKYQGAKYDSEGILVAGELIGVGLSEVGLSEAGLSEAGLGDEATSKDPIAYHDIDGGPSLSFLVNNSSDPEVRAALLAATGKRPADELYDIQTDPACLNNLAVDPKHQGDLQRLSKRLTEYLVKTGDLRQTDPAAAEIWETYPRYSSLRWFEKPEWLLDTIEKAPKQPWLEERRPR